MVVLLICLPLHTFTYTALARVVVCVAFIVVFGATDDPDANPLAAAKKNKDLGNTCFKNGLYESAISVRMHLRL